MIILLHERPYNANQLTDLLGMDYKTIRHHLRVLDKNEVVTALNKGSYGTMYFLTTSMEENYVTFEQIWERFGKKEIG